MLYPDEVVFLMAKMMEVGRRGNPKYAVKMIPKIGKPIHIFEFFPDQKYHDTGEITPTRVVERPSQFAGWYYIEDETGVSLVAKFKPDLTV